MTFTGISKIGRKGFVLKYRDIVRFFWSRRELKRYLGEIRKCEKGIV